MRTKKGILMAMVLTAVLVIAGTFHELRATEGTAFQKSLPASIDALYPPRSGQPVYLMNMLDLETYFSGIAAQVMENDIQGARTTFTKFRSQYMKILEMVSEWKGYYPVEPVEKLGAELKTGEPGRVMQAFGEVGRLCHECHLTTMVQVQQKFHWGDFGSVKLTDPLSGQTVDYALFKKFLASNLAGIRVNLEQGQTRQARDQFSGFRTRFNALKGTCQNCHDQESRYYVAGNMETMLDKLERALSAKAVDAQAVGALMQGVGRESCSKCHLVHVPAAIAGLR